MKKEELIVSMTKDCAEMQSFMESSPTDEATLLVERLAISNVYLARSGKLLADAKLMYNEAFSQAFSKISDKVEKLGTTLATKVLEGYCREEKFLVDWLDRINRGLVHSSDNLRTLISYAKEDMRQTRYVDNIANNGGGFESAEADSW